PSSPEMVSSPVPPLILSLISVPSIETCTRGFAENSFTLELSSSSSLVLISLLLSFSSSLLALALLLLDKISLSIIFCAVTSLMFKGIEIRRKKIILYLTETRGLTIILVYQ
ncbi:MAG TPA: hypothetical protein VE595_04765, partial [Nitrososphaeraceae archaeon]|nr:hypothetical protein [Nitrososphaeraceae archaeon]